MVAVSQEVDSPEYGTWSIIEICECCIQAQASREEPGFRREQSRCRCWVHKDRKSRPAGSLESKEGGSTETGGLCYPP